MVLSAFIAKNILPISKNQSLVVTFVKNVRVFKDNDMKSFKVGDQVNYLNDKTYVGFIIAIGSNMIRVKWNKEGVEEWMPAYALELVK